MDINKMQQEYIALAKIHQEIDYSSKKSVHKGNQAIDKMTEIAKNLNNSPDGIEALKELLEIEKFAVKYYVAFNFLNFLNPAKEIEEKCLLMIQKKAIIENNIAYKIWLREKGVNI